MWTGAGIAAGIELLDCFVTDRKVDWWRVLIAGGIGAAAAAAPDILEPALHPCHRSLFHSLAAGGASAYGLAALGRSAMTDPTWRLVARSALVGYLSHVTLDSTTPRSFPLLC